MKRQRRGLLPSFDSPRRCADLRDTRQRRTLSQGIAACRCRGQKKAGRNLRSRAALRARALWERAANGIRGKVDRQSQPLFSPRGGTGERTLSPACEDGRIAPSVAAVPVFPLRAGRRGRRPLHAQPGGSRFQGRRLPHLRGGLFGGRILTDLYNGGEI